MVHAKFQDHEISSAEDEDFKGFGHIWVWRLSWLCGQNHFHKFISPPPKSSIYWQGSLREEEENGRIYSTAAGTDNFVGSIFFITINFLSIWSFAASFPH